VSVVRFKFCCNILISGKIIKEIPGSVASGTPYISVYIKQLTLIIKFDYTVFTNGKRA